MQYIQFGNTGESLSVLGFGCMRYPSVTVDGHTEIYEAETIRVLRHAVEQGINYFDTAYVYHNQESEVILGKALQGGYREKVNIATKLPISASFLKEPADFDRLLDQQLQRLQTDHIDFYLLHCLERVRWNDIVLKLNLLDKLTQAKKAGKVRHIGFSFHDDYEAFETILNGFDGWEFCQLQLNYADTAHQAGFKGMELAASKGLGVIVMEPLRGGKLAAPAPEVKKALSPEKTPVEWAFDFLWNRSELGPVLSGMSTMEQLNENLVYAEKAHPGMLTEEENKMLLHAGKIFNTMPMIPCTKCQYCMPCPFGLDIPAIYEAYNMTVSASPKAAKDKYDTIQVRADSCRKCKKCEAVCPQAIVSSEKMPQIAARFAEEIK